MSSSRRPLKSGNLFLISTHRAAVPSRESTERAPRLRRAAKWKFLSSRASRVKNPRSAPEEVSKWTSQGNGEVEWGKVKLLSFRFLDRLRSLSQLHKLVTTLDLVLRSVSPGWDIQEWQSEFCFSFRLSGTRCWSWRLRSGNSRGTAGSESRNYWSWTSRWGLFELGLYSD